MEKRHVYRNRRRAAAIAAVGMVGLAAAQASASLTINLYEAGTFTGGATGNKTVSVSSIGDILTLDVFATIAGTNGSGTDDGIQSVFGSFLSNNALGGETKGNLSAALDSRFQGASSQNGLSQDLDLDGDNDLGSNVDLNADNFFFARSNDEVFADDGIGFADAGSPGKFSVKLGTLSFTVTEVGTGGEINFRPRTATSAALWFEDSVFTPDPDGTGPQQDHYTNQKSGNVGLAAGAPIIINVGGGGGPVSAEWTLNANGSWDVPSNWTPSSDPNANNATATFGATGSAGGHRTVTVPGAGRTVKVANFAGTNGYTLSGGTLTMDADTGTPSINVSSANHNIANLTLAKDTTIDVTGGSLSTTNLVATGVTLTKSGAGSLTVNNVRGAGLTMSGGTLTVATNGGAAGASKVESLSHTGGTIDLLDNDLVIGTGSLSAIRSLIFNGDITTTAIAPAGKTTALGYAAGNDPALAIVDLSGQTFDADSVLVKYTFRADADLDGDVDGVDVGFWLNNFTGGGGSTTKNWSEGDWDYDGDVDGVDIGFWLGNFTGGGGGGLDGLVVDAPNANPSAVAMLSAYGVTVVPEPSALGLLGVAGAGLLRRRRKN